MFYLDALDKADGDAKFGAEGGFASGHLAGVRLMVFSRKMQQAVQEKNFYLFDECVTKGAGLLLGMIERYGKVAGHAGCFPRSGKRKDVSGFIFAAKEAIEAAERGVIGKQNVDFTREADGGLGALEKTPQRCFIQRGGVGLGMFGVAALRAAATRRFDGDHSWAGGLHPLRNENFTSKAGSSCGFLVVRGEKELQHGALRANTR